MAFPKVKLCWNGAAFDAEWHLGLFGIYTRSQEGGRLRGIVISGRGLLAWMAGLAVVAYFSGAAALWVWFERKPYNAVTYADLVLPARWSEVRKLRGQATIKEGLADLKEHKWNEAFAKLKAGIARNPDEIEGRLALGEMLNAMKARKQAVEIYDGGLAKRYPGRDYIETMLKVAMNSEDHDWALRTCDRALELVADDANGTGERRWLVQRKLSVLLAADRSDEALALVEAADVSGGPSTNEYRTLALLKAGKPREAQAFLESWKRNTGKADARHILRLQVRAHREAGDPAAMDQSLEELRALTPTDPRPYVYAVVQQLIAGRRAEADAALERFLSRFGSSARAVLMLATPLVEIEERSLIERLLAYARQQGFDPEPFSRLLMEVLVARGEWREAERVMAEASPKTKKEEPAASWYAIMEAQIQAAIDPSDAAQSKLVGLVRGRSFAVGFYKSLIANMRRAGRPATAREILTFAQGVYPKNKTIEGWRVELDAEVAAAREAAKATLAPVTRPVLSGTETAQASGRVVASEAEFMARLEALTENREHTAALQAIREIRFAKPIWLGAKDAELSRQEVRLSGLSGDVLAMRAAVRLFNNGDPHRSAQLVQIAREFHGASRTDEALFVLKELLAKTPDYPFAARLLTEWTPKTEAKAP